MTFRIRPVFEMVSGLHCFAVSFNIKILDLRFAPTLYRIFGMNSFCYFLEIIQIKKADLQIRF